MSCWVPPAKRLGTSPCRRRQEHHTSINTKNAGSYYTDVFSMIGTLALWIFWPSFNGALASYSAETGALRSSYLVCTILKQQLLAAVQFYP